MANITKLDHARIWLSEYGNSYIFVDIETYEDEEFIESAIQIHDGDNTVYLSGYNADFVDTLKTLEAVITHARKSIENYLENVSTD